MIGLEAREAVRQLRRAPGFAAAAVLMLALGLMASIGMYSLLRGVLLTALPYPDPEAVLSVGIAEQGAAQPGALTPAEAMALSEASASGRAPQAGLAGFAYYNWGGLTFEADGEPREISIVLGSPQLFPTLGMPPLLGRWLTAEDYRADSRVAVLSHAEWQRVLGGRPDAVGQKIQTSEGVLEVVGVMPADFAFPAPQVGAWLPRGPYRATAPGYHEARFVFGVARRTPSISTVALAQALEPRLPAATSSADSAPGLRLTPLLEELTGEVSGTLWSAFAMSLLVLLIALVTLGILYDARLVQRAPMLALSQALGASRARLLRGQWLELGLLTLAGLCLGLGLAMCGLDLLRELARDSLPRVDTIQLDPGVLIFAIVLALSVPPLTLWLGGALRRCDSTAGTLRASGRGLVRSGARGWLPALAVALCTTSLVAAIALAFSLRTLQQVDPGHRVDDIRALQVFRPGVPAALQDFSTRLQARLQALPGVVAAGYTAAPPLAIGASLASALTLPGRDRPEPWQAGLRRVSPDYTDTLEIPLLAGRGLAASDNEGAEAVTVVNATLARRAFGSTQAALGQLLRVGLQGEGDGEAQHSYRIVGVVGDVRNAGLRLAPEPELLLPYAQGPAPALTFLVRGDPDAPALTDRMLVEALWQIDPHQAPAFQYALSDALAGQLATVRFFARTVSAFALAALLLAVLGVYAVAALGQRQRMPEFGVRAALGASALSLGRLVLGEGLRRLLPAALAGLGGAALALHLLGEQLHAGRGALIALSIACAVCVLVMAGLALALPAWRAARVDPQRVLRP